MKTINSIFTLAMVLFCLTFGASYANASTSDIDAKLENSGNAISWKGKVDEFKAITTKMERRALSGKLQSSLQIACGYVEDSCNLEVLNNPRKKEELLDELQETLSWLILLGRVQARLEYTKKLIGMKPVNDSDKTVDAIKCLTFIIQEVAEYK